jgi:hypothetical protein
MDWWEKLFSSCTEGALNERRVLLANQLRNLVTTLLAGSAELQRSDIVRTINYSMIEHAVSNPKLFIFSDMVENSELISATEFFQSKLEKLSSRVRAAALIPATKGGVVKIFGVGRNQVRERGDLGTADMQKLEEFWRWYFRAAGAVEVQISPRFAY